MLISDNNNKNFQTRYQGRSDVTYLEPSVRVWPLVSPGLTLLPSLGILHPPAGCDALPENLEVSLCGDKSGACLTGHVTRGMIYIRDLAPCTAYTIIIREGRGEEVWRGRGVTPGLSQVKGNRTEGAIINVHHL